MCSTSAKLGIWCFFQMKSTQWRLSISTAVIAFLRNNRSYSKAIYFMYTYKQDSSVVYAPKNTLQPSTGNTCKVMLKKKDRELIKLNVFKRRHSRKCMSVLHVDSPLEVHHWRYITSKTPRRPSQKQDYWFLGREHMWWVGGTGRIAQSHFRNQNEKLQHKSSQMRLALWQYLKSQLSRGESWGMTVSQKVKINQLN